MEFKIDTEFWEKKLSQKTNFWKTETKRESKQESTRIENWVKNASQTQNWSKNVQKVEIRPIIAEKIVKKRATLIDVFQPIGQENERLTRFNE